MTDPIPLRELEAVFLKVVDETHMQEVATLSEADGVRFACPKCYADAGRSLVGVHGVLCWAPRVPQSMPPTPGRWNLVGTNIDDLSLVAGSSSIQITSGCMWHGFVQNGHAVL